MTDESARQKAVQNYENALSYLIAATNGVDTGFSVDDLRSRLYQADIEIMNHPDLRDTTAYRDAVYRADRRAWTLKWAAQRAAEPDDESEATDSIFAEDDPK